MGFFVWKDSFNIGNAEIDLQHRSFLETLNEYYEITFGGKKDTVDKELVNKLKTYAATHFRFEEDLMQSVGYKAIERHRKQHRYFESLVLDFESAHLQGKTQTLMTAVEFLRDWFLNHILDEDKKFFPSLMPQK
ncbi:MAG: bacteriohemerythrin [Desulfomonilaceae bacterium]